MNIRNDQERGNKGLYRYQGSGYLDVAQGTEDEVGIVLANLFTSII